MNDIVLYLPKNELSPFVQAELNSLAIPFEIRSYRIEKIIRLIERDFHFFLQDIKSSVNHANFHYGLIRACESIQITYVPTATRFQLLNDVEKGFYISLMAAFVRAYAQHYKQKHFHEITEYIKERDETLQKIESLESENSLLSSQITQQQDAMQQLLQKIEGFETSIKDLEGEVSRQQTFKEKQEKEEKERDYQLKKHEIDTNARNQKSREEFELEKARLQLETTRLRLRQEQENAEKFENTVRDLQKVLKD